MFPASNVTRAVQYVRMSTEHQQYSAANQKEAIAAWADERGIQIVGTYEDAGKSGLTLAGRPALRTMIADVLAHPTDFNAILVYDVSRWGRFQDADESAHLEFLCRSAGVSVHYCAEPFANDGSPLANLCKVLKRALAAEYSRELSEKTRRGKARLARMGFHQGAPPGFALQRRMKDQHGKDKGPLFSGEQKSQITNRVILTPGSADAVSTVQWMYRTYADRGVSMAQLRDELNARGILNVNKRWSLKAVSLVLRSPKYVGDNVWGMTSVKLLTPRRKIPQDQWIVCKNAFEPIVPRDLYERVRAKREALARKVVTNDELVERLKNLNAREGRVSGRLMVRNGLYPKVYKKRFGSVAKACQLCGCEPPANPRDLRKWTTRSERRRVTVDHLRSAVEIAGGTFVWNEHLGEALINGEVRVGIASVAPRTFSRSDSRGWRLGETRLMLDITLLERLDSNDHHLDYLILSPREARRTFHFRDANEEFLERMKAMDLTLFTQMSQRLPLDTIRFSASQRQSRSNPFAIDSSVRRTPRLRRTSKHSVRAKRYCVAGTVAAYLARKRMFIDNVETTWSLKEQLLIALRAFLADPNVITELKATGLVTAPEVIFESHGAKIQNCYVPPSRLQSGNTRRSDGLCEDAVALLGGKNLCRLTTAFLAKMNNQRQVWAVREMCNEQRWSSELARVLYAVTPSDQLVIQHAQPRISRLYSAFAREASIVETIYQAALDQYLSEAMSLAVLSAFGRSLARDGCFENTRLAAGVRPTKKLSRAVLNEEAWRAAKAFKFSRGWKR